MQPCQILLTLIVLAAPAAAGSLSVFVGPAGGAGNVRILDASLVCLPYDVPGLTNIRLVALDHSGRAGLQQLSACAPRLRDDVPGASRLSLPSGAGSLYHFVRNEGAWDEAWGFFLVDASRVARVVLEYPALQPGVDPFLPRIAVAPDGSALLVATSRSAGGDLFEVDLVSARVRSRTANLAPLGFRGRGLALLPAFGVAVHEAGILRVDRSVDGDASAVGFAPGEYPAWFERSVVASCNGAWIATVAGESSQITYPHVVGAQGIARRMAQLPRDVQGAGLAPDAANGPWLAVSDDGLSCAWRVRPWGPWIDAELYLGSRPDPSASGIEEHVTHDAAFAPYLDEVGVFVFTPTGRLVFVAGDPGSAGSSQFGSADVFRASRGTTGALELENLTATSGEALPPFLHYGTLELSCVAWIEPAEAYVALEREGVGHRLIAADGRTGCVRELVTGVSSLPMLELAPQHLVLATHGSVGSGVPALLRMPIDLSTDPEVLLAFLTGVQGMRGAIGAGGHCALVTTDGTGDALWHVDVGSAFVTPLAYHALCIGPTLDVLRDGAIRTTLSAAAGTTTTTWSPPGAPARVEVSTQAVFVLAGP